MNTIKSRIGRYLESLRFPVLLMFAAVLFFINMLVPDVIPFVDELLMALVVALLARMKRPGNRSGAGKEKDEGEQ